MSWRKLGRVFCPDGSRSWAKTHALMPTPVVIGDVLRVYFAALDAQSFGRAGWVDLDPDDPTRVLREASEPALELGALGTFDDSGVTPSCVLWVGSELWMYYVGWQRAERVPYLLFAGLAKSRDQGQSFERVSPVPVLDRSSAEPFSRGAPFVAPASGGGFRGWYWTSQGWSRAGGSPHYNNDICEVHSTTGLSWPDQGACAVARRPDGGEFSLGRPWVSQSERGWELWYTIRSHAHPDALGVATSADGVSWVRDDAKVGLARSPSGWDSEMVCYASLIGSRGRELLFYNGNRHGLTGFGVAARAG
ncbi:MAG: hypothetical protein IT377_14730 [Polyangiaceae bacterium]|nr:hypothetical protein [Polyangiaceae bacterium]